MRDFSKSEVIGHHQACRHPSCSSSDAASLYRDEDGGYHGYCYSCENFYWLDENLNYVPNQSTQKQPIMTNETIQSIQKTAVFSEIPDRKISRDICEKFGVLVTFDQQNGTIDKHYYPQYRRGNLSGYKIRKTATKEFYSIGDAHNLDLFGQNLIGNSYGKMIIITEGELDALAAAQLFKNRHKTYRIVSLPNGANSRSVKSNYEWLMNFDYIILCLDQDVPGKEVAQEIGSYFPPGKIKIMSFSEKDACDMLKEGKELEFLNSLYNAQPYKPDGIVSVDDVYDEAIKPIEMGLSWPFPTLTKATYGYRRKELYGVGGASGGGKTEFLKEFINHSTEVHRNPVGVFFLEEPVAKTLKVLAGKKFNKRFHIPEGDWTIDELKSGIDSLKGKVYLYNHYGAKDWDSIKAKIRYMVVALGIKDIVLDHLTALVAQEDNEYHALNRIMEEMASLTQELDFTLIYISHLRKANGVPHEEGGRVTADQFKGSGAIVYWSHFLFGIERDQQAEDYDVRNTTTFRVLKDRVTGLSTGLTFKLYYDHHTGRWQEKDEDEYGEF